MASLSTIVTTDLHLKDNELDEYRWSIFAWLRAQAVRYHAEEILLLGDVTDRKEGHSARLVNRLYKEMHALSEVARVFWLMGNHDFYVDSALPFFQFLDGGLDGRITYIRLPGCLELSIGKATFVPAGVKWNFKLLDFPYTFTHATFSGAKAENGMTLTGVDPDLAKDYKGIIYSGDIHKPQDLRQNIVYVGAPYHTRFGDDFTPRIIGLYKNGDEVDLHFPAPRKLVLNITKPGDLFEEKVRAGDHVKVRCHLRRADYVQWKKYREEIREIVSEKQWRLFSMEPVPLEMSQAQTARIAKANGLLVPAQLVEQYGARQKASPEHIKIGKELLR